MALQRSADWRKKKILLEQINRLLKEQKPLVLISYRGLKGNEISLLRKTLKEKEGSLKIIKTSLFRKALGKTPLSLEENILKRPLAIVYNSEPIGLSKIVYDFSKNSPNLEIVGGIFEGRFNKSAQIKELALLPSVEELQRRLVQTLNTSLLKLQLVLSNLPNRLVLALKTINQ